MPLEAQAPLAWLMIGCLATVYVVSVIDLDAGKLASLFGFAINFIAEMFVARQTLGFFSAIAPSLGRAAAFAMFAVLAYYFGKWTRELLG